MAKSTKSIKPAHDEVKERELEHLIYMTEYHDYNKGFPPLDDEKEYLNEDAEDEENDL